MSQPCVVATLLCQLLVADPLFPHLPFLQVKSMSEAIMQRSASPRTLIKAAPEHYPSTNSGDPTTTADSCAAAMQGEDNLCQQLRHGSILDEVEQLITQAWGTGVKTEVVLRLLGLGHCRCGSPAVEDRFGTVN
jgi:hypothetical protein